MRKNSALRLSALGAALVVTATLGVSSAQAHNPGTTEARGKTVTLNASLTELNNSGVSGSASAVVHNKKIKHIEVHAEGLSPDAPHAQHIHYGDDALNECPTLELDSNGDGRLNTLEGLPAYGPVVVSLTTSGDTSPASLLAVDRFPVADNGVINYSRDNIKFTDVAGTGYGADGLGTAEQIADAIRDGEGVLVIHGLDYDGNGAYNLSAEGASDLDPNLPAEATDPAACGILR
ncbi:MAG: hypothetical protein WED09_01375 [Homoserinimonas sp.]